MKIQFTVPHLFLWPVDYHDATQNLARLPLGDYYQYLTGIDNRTISVFSASQPSGTFINFWICVKQNKIIIILRGDPAFSGQSSMCGIQKYTPIDSAFDKQPWIYYGILGAPAAHKNSRAVYTFPYYGMKPVQGAATSSMTINRTKWSQMFESVTKAEAVLTVPSTIPETNPASVDSKWWLYKLFSYSQGYGLNSAGLYDILEEAGFRGNTEGLYYLSQSGWAHLDELVDGGTTYLLVTLSNSFAGSARTTFAILQEA